MVPSKTHWALIAFCAAGAGLRAQDTDARFHRQLRYDDAQGEIAWKLNSPAGGSDYFSVDLEKDLNGRTITALMFDSVETAAKPGNWASIGVYENCAPGVPDLALPASVRTNVAVPAGDPLGDILAYSIPCTALGSPANGYSMVMADTPGDSHTWLAADTSSGATGRSYFSSNGYSGCTSVAATSMNWLLGAGYAARGGELMVNGSSSARISQNGGQACFVFYAPTLDTPGMTFLIKPFLFRLLLIKTDGRFPGPCPMSWALCQTFSCDDVAFPRFQIAHFYLDFLDTKIGGKPRIKLSNTVDVSIFPDKDCSPGGCFGIRDDCIMDGFVWKVQDPAGPSDWFSVNHGRNNVASTLTGVAISSWDFCGTGPSWAEVGIYTSNFSVDSTGCVPDVQNPLTAVGGSSAAMLPDEADWGCPLTFYDTPDISADTTTNYLVAAKWFPNDTCIWLGSDTDGFDNACGDRIPNNGCTSLFSTDNYTTPGTRFTNTNWMMQIRWN